MQMEAEDGPTPERDGQATPPARREGSDPVGPIFPSGGTRIVPLGSGARPVRSDSLATASVRLNDSPVLPCVPTHIVFVGRLPSFARRVGVGLWSRPHG